MLDFCFFRCTPRAGSWFMRPWILLSLAWCTFAYFGSFLSLVLIAHKLFVFDGFLVSVHVITKICLGLRLSMRVLQLTKTVPSATKTRASSKIDLKASYHAAMFCSSQASRHATMTELGPWFFPCSVCVSRHLQIVCNVQPGVQFLLIKIFCSCFVFSNLLLIWNHNG